MTLLALLVAQAAAMTTIIPPPILAIDPVVVLSIAQPYPVLKWRQGAGSQQQAETQYAYRYFLDKAKGGNMLARVTCDGKAPSFNCTAELPITQTGPHSLTLMTEWVADGVKLAVSQESGIVMFQVTTDGAAQPLVVTIH